MWMPDDPMATPLAAQGEVRPRTFGIFVLNDSHKTLKARAKVRKLSRLYFSFNAPTFSITYETVRVSLQVVDEWTTNGGVLLIGYEMYRQLSLKKLSKPKKSRRKRIMSDDEDLDPEEEEKRQKEMLESKYFYSIPFEAHFHYYLWHLTYTYVSPSLCTEVYEALVKPGPDLVICDEGHRIKNSHASISMALKQIKSKRRVVLTGYPLQNNLLEYWSVLNFNNCSTT